MRVFFTVPPLWRNRDKQFPLILDGACRFNRGEKFCAAHRL